MPYRRSAIILVLLLLSGRTAFAVSQSTFLFLTIPPSPQANGMAGVYSAAGNDDPLAPLSVPSAIGLMGENTKVQVAFYPHRTEWLPGWHLDDLTFATRSLFIGFNQNWVKKHLLWDAPLSIGFGYYEVDLDLGTTERTDAQGNSLGSFHSWENSKALGLGIGWHARKLQAGFGFNHKWAHSDLSPFGADEDLSSGDADGFATDVGLLFRVPFDGWWSKATSESESPAIISPFLTPELGYSLLNFGDEVAYIDRVQADPLPRTGKLHVGLSTGLDLQQKWLAKPLRLLSFNWGRTAEDELVRRGQYGDVHYRNLLADIKPLKDLSGKTNENAILRTGWEIGMLETVYMRAGRREDAEGNMYLNYDGSGYRAAGCFKLLSALSFIRQCAPAVYFLNHVDIQYHQSKCEAGYSVQDHYFSDHPWDGRTDEQISLYFRY